METSVCPPRYNPLDGGKYRLYNGGPWSKAGPVKDTVLHSLGRLRGRFFLISTLHLKSPGLPEGVFKEPWLKYTSIPGILTKTKPQTKYVGVIKKTDRNKPKYLRSLTEALNTGEYVFVTFLGLVTKYIRQKQLWEGRVCSGPLFEGTQFLTTWWWECGVAGHTASTVTE